MVIEIKQTRRPTTKSAGGKVDNSEAKKCCLSPPPPATQWFDDWILYEDWFVADHVLAASKEAFIRDFGGPKRFGRNIWLNFMAWSEHLAGQQPGPLKGQVALPKGERSTIIVGLDRLAGIDDYGKACRVFAESADLHEPNGAGLLTYAGLLFGYPNDDAIYVSLCTLELAHDSAYRPGGAETFAACLAIPVAAAMAWWLQIGLNRASIDGLGQALGLAPEARFIAFRQHIEKSVLPNMRLTLVTVLLIWLFAPLTLDIVALLFLGNRAFLFVGVFWAAMLGGLFLSALTNIVSLVFIRMGYDPMRMVLDDVIIAVLGIAVLWYFDNSWLTIFGAVVIGMAPGVLYKLPVRKTSPNPCTSIPLTGEAAVANDGLASVPLTTFVVCPSCQKKLRVRVQREGKSYRCPNCKVSLSS